MPSLPGGTLTLLFSDIEGSTSMLQRLGARWGEALTAHREILRATFAEHDGREMGTEGDSFFVVFTSAQHAVLAAVEGQRRLLEHDWPDDSRLRVRMGLHTGEPERHGEGYIGLDVHQAARIAATAHGGQVVLSAATQALAASVGDDIGARDLGLHRLKDLPEPVHLYELTAPGLLGDHPPLRSLGTQANLPAYASEIIGREREVDDVTGLLEDTRARLVTLTGTGGTGKTRLAVAVARDLQDRFPHEIIFVPLHTADRAALMWSGISEAVGAPVDAEVLPHDRVRRFLADRTALLVLDNLEQIPEAADVVADLLAAAPGVAVLATSRRPLHLVDEHVYPVAVLAVPAVTPQDVEAARAGAVELFEQRARMVRPSFRLTPDNLDAVVTLCRRLDGLPLAIELAAARSQLLSPRALLARIDDHLGDRLTTGHRASRQQTLAATIAWSWDLLDDDSQRALRRLGVFAGRVGLDAVQAVAADEGEDPLDLVAHLVDVSLVEIVEGSDGEPMVLLLETIRRFARDRLGAAGERDDIRLRHARWCVHVATGISALLTGPHQMTALDRMEAVEEDIRSALDWCLAPGRVTTPERRECGLALLEPMDAYWYRFGYIAEGRAWHDRALGVLESDDDADPGRLVDALHGKGILAVQQNDLATGSQALERALELAHRIGDPFRESRESNSLGVARREAGDTEAARELILRSTALARDIGDTHREAIALSNVVQIHLDAGEYGDAVVAARRAVEADRALGDPWGVAINQCNLIPALLNAEGAEAALEQFVAVADEAVALGDVELSLDLLDSGASVWAALGEGALAATLLGASDRQREVAGIPRADPDQRHLDRFVTSARESLGPAEWDRARDRGATLAIEDAVAEGLAHSGGFRPFAGRPGAPEITFASRPVDGSSS
ncbi:ATP-binding protein [Knoellia sp. CPCC 206450]|uniref:ATP-binding protein n=1 Tax=Knoellia tibetensis TaxID=3404798 RepID=UPI003B42B030